MSGLKDVEDRLTTRKLSLQDYKTALPQEVITVKPKKVKLTIYLSEEIMTKLNEICAKNVLQNGKLDKSSLMEQAVELLYEKIRRDSNE